MCSVWLWFPFDEREIFDKSGVLYTGTGIDIRVKYEMPWPRQAGEQGLHVPSHAQCSACGLYFLPLGFATICLAI